MDVGPGATPVAAGPGAAAGATGGGVTVVAAAGVEAPAVPVPEPAAQLGSAGTGMMFARYTMMASVHSTPTRRATTGDTILI